VGGKQGNGYLLDAGNYLNNPTPNPNQSPAPYPASLTVRPPVVNPNQDPSLYDLGAIRSYFTPPQAGPLALFQPYNGISASGNTAKARDTPATFTASDGTQYVIWAGSSKAAVGSGIPVAPSLYLTQVVAVPGQPAFLRIAAQHTQVMSLPGANIITANGTADPIDWIVDAGVQRTDGETSFFNGAPTLYAYDALMMEPLWSSAYQQLDMGGRYNTIAAARGQVFVGTDRIQAFGLTNDLIVDDAVQGTELNQFTYVGSGWTHTPPGTSTSTMGTFAGTVSTDTIEGDYATLTFTGSRIKVYANEARSFGSVTISVDGANAQTIALANTTNSPNGLGEGDVLIYTLSGFGAGTHTVRFMNAGDGPVALDRVEITPPITASSALGVSLTEGNGTPVPGQVLPYTINFNNAGSLVDGTGTSSTGVVLTETVPANTTADLSDSTPGWTLTSGSGDAGSTFTFTVGALSAGATGSVVFSVNVNRTIPAGTLSLSNTVTIMDAAADSGTGTRVTPLAPPVATALTFTQQPTNGLTGVPLTPAVTVAVQDQYGNTFADASGSTVTLTLNDGTFADGGNSATASVVNGVATFDDLVIDAAGTYTLIASDGSLAGAVSDSFTIAASMVTTVDDAVKGTGPDQFRYVGTWSHVGHTNIPNTYNGTWSYTDTPRDYVTIHFTGTQITLYVVQRDDLGIAGVSIDHGPMTDVDEYAVVAAGDVLVYTSPLLPDGPHTFKMRNTGTHNASSSGFRVDIDRVDILQSSPGPVPAGTSERTGNGHVGNVIPDGLVGGPASTKPWNRGNWNGTRIPPEPLLAFRRFAEDQPKAVVAAGMVGLLPLGIDDRPLADLDNTIAGTKAHRGGRLDDFHVRPLVAVVVDVIGDLAE
jgi:hypothetical protein